ncbi:MAG: cell wall hydrolase [Rhodospirillales bacterium]
MHAEQVCCRPAIGTADAAFLLALFLWDEARGESVRVREALAATIANQVRVWQETAAGPPRPGVTGAAAGAARALLFAACLDRQGRREVAPPPAADPVFAACQRIARRAVNGALADPTGGAVRFHRLGVRPTWAAELEPGPLIGCFLFYMDAEAYADAHCSSRFGK